MIDLPSHAGCDNCEAEIREYQQLVATTGGVERAFALMSLGDTALLAMRFDLALASYGACRELLPLGELEEFEGQALYKESCVLAELGRFEEAIELGSRAKEICERYHDLEHLALCEWRLGLYYFDGGRVAHGRELVAYARDRYIELDRPAMAALVEMDLARISKPAVVKPLRSKKRKRNPKRRRR